MGESRPLPGEDLSEILERSRDDFLSLQGASMFITGGTGFVGTWLVEALLEANQKLSLNLKLTMLVRDVPNLSKNRPRITGNECISLLPGDILNKVEASTSPDFIVHAATPASASLNEKNPQLMFDTIVNGMRNVLEMAGRGSTPRMLFTSSGAVHGRQPPDLSHVPESFMGAPDQLLAANAYHEGKRAAELLGAIATEQGVADVVTGRLFAFVGPYLPIDAHFAVGNFIRDALAGGSVIVGGDGTPVRSYQYAADMVVWLLALLVRGEAGRAYNVGSEKEIDIASLAETVATEAGGSAVEIHGTPMPGKLAERYVPDCSRARLELGLENHVDLKEAIRRTAQWHRAEQR